MKKRRRLAAATLALLAGCGIARLAATPKNLEDWVLLKKGHLVYTADANGNRIPDFSTAGYGMGGVPLPDLPVKARIDALPGEGDDTVRLQQAIEDIGKLPADSHGWRGALLLGPGEFRFAGTLKLDQSGVVLRGSGSGAGGTTLRALGDPHVVLTVGGSGALQEQGGRKNITDTLVPVGAHAVTVDATPGDFHPGDRVIVQWNMSQPFLHTIGMDHIQGRKDGREVASWNTSFALRFDRRIVAVEPLAPLAQGVRLTLDADLTQQMNLEDHAVVYRYTFPGRVSQVGVEDLASDGSSYEHAKGFGDAAVPAQKRDQPSTPHREDGSFFESIFSQWDVVEDGWMRRVRLSHYNNLVIADSHARALTFEDITGDHVDTPPKRNHAAPFAFQVAGQQILMQRCNIESGHLNHVWATQARVAGPNVFRDSFAKGSELDAGPHQRWATGTLYEGLTLQGRFDAYDQEGLGTGHGWAGAYNLIWNSTVDEFQIESPPGAYIWIIGSSGKIDKNEHGDRGYFQSYGKPMEPVSLYDEQLKERLAGQAH